MMKENIKRRFCSKFSLVALSLVAAAGIFIAVQRGKIGKDSKSILEQQRFIDTHILSGDDNKESISAGFDLKEKEFFYYHGAAIKNSKLYGGSQEYSAAEYYKRALDIELTSALLNHHINIEDIKDSNYQITRSTVSFINKKLLDENIRQNLKVDILSRIVNFPKFVSPTTKSFCLLKLSGIIKIRKG